MIIFALTKNENKEIEQVRNKAAAAIDEYIKNKK